MLRGVSDVPNRGPHQRHFSFELQSAALPELESHNVLGKIPEAHDLSAVTP